MNGNIIFLGSYGDGYGNGCQCMVVDGYTCRNGNEQGMNKRRASEHTLRSIGGLVYPNESIREFEHVVSGARCVVCQYLWSGETRRAYRREMMMNCAFFVRSLM